MYKFIRIKITNHDGHGVNDARDDFHDVHDVHDVRDDVHDVRDDVRDARDDVHGHDAQNEEYVDDTYWYGHVLMEVADKNLVLVYL